MTIIKERKCTNCGRLLEMNHPFLFPFGVEGFCDNPTPSEKEKKIPVKIKEQKIDDENDFYLLYGCFW